MGCENLLVIFVEYRSFECLWKQRVLPFTISLVIKPAFSLL